MESQSKVFSEHESSGDAIQPSTGHKLGLESHLRSEPQALSPEWGDTIQKYGTTGTESSPA